MFTAAMGGAYEFTRTAAANLRESNDSYNEAIGGFFSGAMLGIRCQSTPFLTSFEHSSCNPSIRLSLLQSLTEVTTNHRKVRTIPSVIGFGTGLSIVMATFDYTGGSFFGYQRDPDVDEYERKEALRANKRRPVGETLEQLGEGRGMSFISPYAEAGVGLMV